MKTITDALVLCVSALSGCATVWGLVIAMKEYFKHYRSKFSKREAELIDTRDTYQRLFKNAHSDLLAKQEELKEERECMKAFMVEHKVNQHYYDYKEEWASGENRG